MSSYAEIVVDRSIDDGWKTFRTRLAEHLLSDEFGPSIDLVPAEKEAGVLVVEEPDGTVGVWAVIDKPRTAGSRRLRGLGFERDADGWHLGVGRRYADRAAHAVYVVLHELLGVIHPSLIDIDPVGLDLWDDLADETPPPVVVPDLAWANDAEGLQCLVDATLEPAFGHPPIKDDDGDIRVTNDDGGCVYVSVRAASSVEVWAILAHDVDPARARKAIQRLSLKYRHHKFHLWNRALVASVPLFAHPYVPALLHAAIGGTLYVSAKETERQTRRLQRPQPAKRCPGDNPEATLFDDLDDGDAPASGPTPGRKRS